MMLDPAKSVSSTYRASTASAGYYTYSGGVNWVTYAVARVVQEFFRDQGEPVSAGTIDASFYSAQISQSSWLQSVMKGAQVALEVPSVPVVDSADANTTLDAHEVESAMRYYQMLRDMKLTDMTYEDYLRQSGVNVPEKQDIPQPELIRYIREWTYPSNTIDPTSGAPRSALSWSIAERADKDRFFKEPGLILGLSVSRPKVYLSKQLGSAMGMMDDALSWLHPMLQTDDVMASMKKFNTATGPIPGNTDSYMVDVADLLMYGDQFVNFAMTATDAGLVAVPTPALVKKYPSQADVDALFVDAAGGKKYVRQDGVVSLNILSRVVDRTAKV